MSAAGGQAEILQSVRALPHMTQAEVAWLTLTVNRIPGFRQQTVDQIWPARRNSFPRHS
jgi:hypothetical protein